MFQDVRHLKTFADFLSIGSSHVSLKWQKSPYAALKESAFLDKNTTFTVDETTEISAISHTANSVNSQQPVSYTWYRDPDTNFAFKCLYPELREDTYAEIHLFTTGSTSKALIMGLNLSPELYVKLDDEMDNVLQKRKLETLLWSKTDPKKRLRQN